MEKFKVRFKESTAIKMVIAIVLTVAFTTSVFAATGVFNKQEISTEDLQAAIEEKVSAQLSEKIAALMTSQETTEEIEGRVSEKLNKDEILNKLREQISSKLANTEINTEVSEDKLNEIINAAIDSTMDTLVDNVINSAIENALANYDINDTSVSIEDYLTEAVEKEVEKQINAIIAENLDTVVEEAISTAIDNALKDAKITIKKTEPVSDFVTLDVDTEGLVVTIDPTSAWNGKTLGELLEANKDELKLDYSTTEYGMWLNDIEDIVPEGYYPVKLGNKLVKGNYYLAYAINGDYAEVGVSSEIIDEDDVYTFYVDGYNSEDVVLAEIEVFDALPSWAPVGVWGATQSAEFPSFIVHVYQDIDGLDLEAGQKVEDVITKLGLVIEVSGTGYSKFTYGDKSLSQSAIVNNRRAFVPSVYTMTANGDSYKLGYAKGVHPAKSSVEIVPNGQSKSYFFANEWDGKTQKSEVEFD